MSDSVEVRNFVAAFQKLRTLVDDSPELIVSEAQDNKALHKLRHVLFEVALEMRRKEKNRRELFASPVNPEFIAAWRDYQSNYSDRIYLVVKPDLPDWNEQFGKDPPDSARSLVVDPAAVVELSSNHPPGLSPKNDSVQSSAGNAENSFETFLNSLLNSPWKKVDCAAFETWLHIEFAMDWFDNVLEELCTDYREDGKMKFDGRNGVAAWRNLIREVGLDARGVFRRRQLVPFVMIPRHVSARHGATDPVSLLALLRQAQEAFVFGVPFAVTALMRALLDTILKLPLHF